MDEMPDLGDLGFLGMVQEIARDAVDDLVDESVSVKLELLEGAGYPIDALRDDEAVQAVVNRFDKFVKKIVVTAV